MNNAAEIYPSDEYNQELISNLHPPDWQNPEPAARYNLVVIGAGAAGLVSAAGAAGLGAKVAIVERHFMGGDCLNTGCVPSKCLIRSSRAAFDVRDAERFGIQPEPGSVVDFPALMERMRRLRARISANDSVQRFSELGVDVFLGEGRFSGPDTIEVDGKKLRFKKAVIATGARAVEPSIEGISEAGYLTNETVFNLTERPKRLAVIGAGPIGCELAQAFQRLGSTVTLIDIGPQLLSKEDRDAAESVAASLRKDGVDLRLNTAVLRVNRTENSKQVTLQNENGESIIEVDEILAGVGRAPNIEGLNLECTGVEYDAGTGVAVNDFLQTANKNIFAAGDICMKYKFTHAADAAARIVIQNALFPMGRGKLIALTVPWCTYTDPEIAHVGLAERDAHERGLEIDTFVQPMNEVDRAIADGEEEGFVKIHTRKGTDRILGATIVARHAGEMIGEITLAMVAGLGMKTLSKVIHPYPTQAEAIRKAADAYNRTRLTPTFKHILNGWMSWNR